MSFEKEDESFNLPDLSQYCSSEKNTMSLIGRILNVKNMSDIILDMLRNWQIYDRMKGATFSKEKFQFIFKYEHDLKEILRKGIHTYNQWALMIERWVEKPMANYLQFIFVWVQLQNIHGNYYTIASITALGDFVGQVIKVAFGPTNAQNKNYVRV